MINVGDWISKWSLLQPQRTALISEDRPYTYQEVNQRTNQLCHLLFSIGVRKRDRIAVLLHNCHQYLEIYFALSKIGAILVPLNWRLAGPELEFILKDSGCKMLIFEPEFEELVASIRPNLNLPNGSYVTIGEPHPDWSMPRINVEQGLFPLPGEVSFEEATFVEPLACVLRGQRLAHVQPGQTVLVIGSAVAGLLHIQLARTSGVGYIMATDIVDYRLDAARKFGADAAVHARDYTPASLRQAAHGRLADLVVICSGAMSAINQALESVERGGTVLFFAPTEPGVSIPLSINDLFWRNEITLTSSYGVVDVLGVPLPRVYQGVRRGSPCG